jgi:predicted metal-dependent hydrolase
VTEAKRVETCKKVLQNWYKRQLTEYLNQQLDLMATTIGVDFGEVKVRSYKRRWGSCSSTGVLSFNLLLAMAPTFVVDYVMIHELCHRVHMNHSAPFWALVRRFCPEFELAKQWLKDNGDQLVLDS